VLNEAFVPDERKAEVRKRLARLKGQVEGVDRMLEQNRPCVEILTQISAAQEALRRWPDHGSKLSGALRLRRHQG